MLPALLVLCGESFPRTPSRRVRRVCFSKRVHGSCVCELPQLWGRVGGLAFPSPRGKVAEAEPKTEGAHRHAPFAT